MQVTYFQRKPRPNANYSIERVFDSVRHELATRIEARVCVAPCCSSGLFRRLWIAWHAWRHQGRINHVTGDTNFTALALDGKRTILTNHDCGYILQSSGLRRWLLCLFWLRLPVRHVAAVTVVSSQVKEEVVHFTGCAPEKIHVIPNAVLSEFRPYAKIFNAECPRILHLGTAHNKNLMRLIDAVAGMACRLVIVGQINDDVRCRLKNERIDYENHVNLSGREILQQYHLCDLLAFASLYEGFGMPILEAQAVGRPVLTSNRQPMSEVAGEGGCLVDPTDSKSIRGGIDRIVSDAEFRSRLVEDGFKNIQRFESNRIAEQYLALYQSVLSASR